MTISRVAVVQAGSVLFDTPATLEKLARLAGEAAAGGVTPAVSKYRCRPGASKA